MRYYMRKDFKACYVFRAPSPLTLNNKKTIYSDEIEKYITSERLLFS